MVQANQEDLLPQSPGTPFPFAQPDVRYDLAHGAGSDPYDGPVDRFGRVTDLLWYDYGASADLLRFKHGYDRASNRLYREEADTSDLDQLYSYDDVNRLVQSEEGTLSLGKDSISSLNFKQQWSLDATGNWSAFKEDDDGDSTWDLEQTRTSNAVNEITDVSETTGPGWITPAYNRAGNMTTIPRPADPTQSYAATYDAWNRLVKLEEGQNTVAEYAFDGAKRLVVRKKYAPGSLSQTRHFYHTAAWQTIEERLESGGNILSTADRQFTWGLRYIDDLVCRTVNSVHDYAYQDANWNVVLSSSALARVVYEPYGQIRSTCPAASGDLDAWQHYFAGYRRDEDTGLYLVRHRVYQPELGCWVQRDPIGFAAGDVNRHRYVLNVPTRLVDSTGLVPITCRCKAVSYGGFQGSVDYYWQQTNCVGLATTCCSSVCSSNALGSNYVSWTGEWDIVGAAPSDTVSPFWEALGAVGDVVSCVNRVETWLLRAVTGSLVYGKWAYDFTAVPNPYDGTVGSYSSKPTRLSFRVTAAHDAGRLSEYEALVARRSAMHAVRNRLMKLGLSKSLASKLSVGIRATGRVFQFVIILECPIYLWCCSEYLRGKRF